MRLRLKCSLNPDRPAQSICVIVAKLTAKLLLAQWQRKNSECNGIQQFKISRSSSPAHLDPANADNSFRQLLHSQREEQGDRQLDSAIQGHGDKDAAGRDWVTQHHVDGERGKDDDLAAGEEGGHVEPSQVGAPQYLADFFPGSRGGTSRVH